MSAGKATFISGIVAGATTGFILGHLTLWNRASSKQDSPSHEVTAALSQGFESSMPAIDIWNPLANSLRQDEVYYAPASDSRQASRPIDITPDDGRPDPPTFLPPPDATPIGTGNEFDLQGMLDREAPELSEEERKVWLDVLEGLTEQDATGIIRMWQLNGGVWPPSIGSELGGLEGGVFDLDTPFAVSNPEADSIAESDSDHAASDVLEELRRVTLHNIANAQTPGYRSLVPVVSNLPFGESTGEDAHDYGIRLERIILANRTGDLIETGDQWDVAILSQSTLFFKLECDGDVALTRYGHFELDAERRFCIAAAGRRWRLAPEVVLPEDVSSFLVDAEGRVLAKSDADEDFAEVARIRLCCLNSLQGLEPLGDRLFSVNDSHCIAQEGVEPSGIAHRHLEGSNVDMEIEHRRLAWIAELIKLRQ